MEDGKGAARGLNTEKKGEEKNVGGGIARPKFNFVESLTT